MRVEHLAIDGSLVTIEGEADLKAAVSASGWAIVPSLLRSQPFSTHPAGYSQIVERTVTSGVPGLKVQSQEEFSIRNGRLRVAEVELPTPAKATRQLTIAAWEGRTACLTSSFVGHDKNRLVRVFETLQFEETSDGIVIDSPVLPTPRPPEVIKEIPELGVMSIRPAISRELQRVPKARGLSIAAGELFRFRQGSRAVMLVTQSAVAVITPIPAGARTQPAPRQEADTGSRASGDVELRMLQTLRVEWRPRGVRSATAA